MKYRVSGKITINCFTDVEANSPDEAKELARDRENCSLIDIERIGESSDEVWSHSGEMDGIPEIEDVEPY